MPEDTLINCVDYLPLEPGNSGHVKYLPGPKSGHFRAYINAGEYENEAHETVFLLNEDPRIIMQRVFITVTGRGICLHNGKEVPCITFDTQKKVGFILPEPCQQYIMGLRPHNPTAEV